MNDKEIKKLFMALEPAGPSAGFEDRIIKNALAKRPAQSGAQYFPRFAAMAAMFLFVFSFSVMNFQKQELEAHQSAEYAQYVDDSAIIDDDDVYDDLIVAYN